MEKDSDFYTDFKVNEEVIVKIERRKVGHDILEKHEEITILLFLIVKYD